MNTSNKRRKTFHVDLNLGERRELDGKKSASSRSSNPPYRDGSERFPFHTLEETKGFLEETSGDHKCLVKCGPDCIKSPCPFPNCTKIMCKEHGEGDVTFIDDDFVHDLQECNDCNRLVCDAHEEKWLKRCDVCAADSSAQIEYYGLDGEDVGPPTLVCRECGQTCGKEYVEPKDEDDGPQFPMSGVEEGDTCKFFCCKECLEEHECFSNPLEYM